MKRILFIIFAIVAMAIPLRAQNTLGVTGGFGTGSQGFYPVVEGRTIYGLSSYGVSWRTYSDAEVVGCFGIDLEYMQRGFSYSPYASTVPEGEQLYYYTRNINSIMLPIVWQPHVYMLYRRVRVFFEAAVTFNYDINSTYANDYLRNLYEEAGVVLEDWKGDYEYSTVRDNRFGYGLAGGGGISLLGGKYEVMARVRYYYGLSDVVKNRNKYYDNGLDGAENPFGLTPTRSPLSNLFINFGISYHFGPEGFSSWDKEKIKTPKLGTGFDYSGEVKTDNNKGNSKNRR